MRNSPMVVIGSRSALRRAFQTIAKTFLIVLIAISGVIAMPAAVIASPVTGEAANHSSDPRSKPATRPAMCRPEPPDYPGCRPWQVRPLLKAKFATEYTGHAPGYRYHRMGQHPRGVIFAHLLPGINARLARLYRTAVRHYAEEHTTVTVGDDGVKHRFVNYPHYRTWAGFRDNATALCTADTVTLRFPVQYCWSITKLEHAGRVVNNLFNQTTKLLFSCDGYALGGWASGSFAAWRLGTGLLEGGYYGAVGVEIGCQTNNLWGWVSNLW